MCDFVRYGVVDYNQEETSVPELDSQLRYGGIQGDEDDDAKRKAEERERKKAEVRKRLEEAGRAKKAKKGFLTPERKKKLRKLLMMKAAEDLKQQQLVKEQERQKMLQSRIVALPNVDGMENQGELQKIYKQMADQVLKLEEEKYDINYAVRQKDFEINELTIAVNDLRGKFVKPTLKKVSKYDNKFKKMQELKKEDKQDFRANLKIVKREQNLDEMMAKKKPGQDKPDWSKKVIHAEETAAEDAEPEEAEAEAEEEE